MKILALASINYSGGGTQRPRDRLVSTVYPSTAAISCLHTYVELGTEPPSPSVRASAPERARDEDKKLVQGSPRVSNWTQKRSFSHLHFDPKPDPQSGH